MGSIFSISFRSSDQVLALILFWLLRLRFLKFNYWCNLILILNRLMLTSLLRLIMSLLWLLLSHWFYNVSFSFLSRDQGSLIRSRLYGRALRRFFQKSIYGLTLVLLFTDTLLILPLSNGFLLWEILRNLLEAEPDYDFWVESSSWNFLILWG
jgi:hypothetical protein